jgi:hypothetical protein
MPSAPASAAGANAVSTSQNVYERTLRLQGCKFSGAQSGIQEDGYSLDSPDHKILWSGS